MGSLFKGSPIAGHKPSHARCRFNPFAKPTMNDRFLRIVVAHGVGRERPLSRQRCASAPIRL
jgi:hypothetical protein